MALVEEEQLTFEATAAASNVSKSTAHTWVTRWRQADDARRADLSCLEDRGGRQHPPFGPANRAVGGVAA